MRRISTALAALTLSLAALSGCTPGQMRAWFDAHGVDHSAMAEPEVQAWADASTLWWDAALAAPPVTVAPPPPARPVLGPFLECVRWRESRGDYTAYNPASGASGAFQFLRATWDNTARHAGRWDLVGVDVRWASPLDQDLMALHLLAWYGPSPWAGPGC